MISNFLILLMMTKPVSKTSKTEQQPSKWWTHAQGWFSLNLWIMASLLKLMAAFLLAKRQMFTMHLGRMDNRLLWKFTRHQSWYLKTETNTLQESSGMYWLLFIYNQLRQLFCCEGSDMATASTIQEKWCERGQKRSCAIYHALIQLEYHVQSQYY